MHRSAHARTSVSVTPSRGACQLWHAGIESFTMGSELSHGFPRPLPVICSWLHTLPTSLRFHEHQNVLLDFVQLLTASEPLQMFQTQDLMCVHCVTLDSTCPNRPQGYINVLHKEYMLLRSNTLVYTEHWGAELLQSTYCMHSTIKRVDSKTRVVQVEHWVHILNWLERLQVRELAL